MERELLKGNTPTLVLAVLEDGPLHGYAIAREIERRSDNALKFKEGTLYPALHALEEQGLVTAEWQRAAGERERKVYTLTPEGHAALAERTRTWLRFTSAVNQVLSPASGEREDRSPASGARPSPVPHPIG